jgi:uncharacterized membrane protein
MTPLPAQPGEEAGTDGLDRTIARLLTAGMYVSVALLAIGVALMAAAGVSPLIGGPAFDPARLVADFVALRPEGFLWLGLVAAIATPSLRVAASFVGYLRRGERAMAVVALLILGVIVVGVLLATATEN